MNTEGEMKSFEGTLGTSEMHVCLCRVGAAPTNTNWGGETSSSNTL